MVSEDLKAVIQATGLPESLLEREIGEMAAKAGLPPGEISLEQLRALLVDYLQDVLVEIKDEVETTK